jgi:predicted nucleic acid-binding protein
MAEAETAQAFVLIDAGGFIGALLNGEPRHVEARSLVEQARQGTLSAYMTTSILSEVYGALTWEKAEPRHVPAEAADAVRLLVEPPSAIVVLAEGIEVTLRTFALAAKHQLTARRIHDARHAATALVNGIASVYTYDIDDWRIFDADGLCITGPPTTLARLVHGRAIGLGRGK